MAGSIALEKVRELKLGTELDMDTNKLVCITVVRVNRRLFHQVISPSIFEKNRGQNLMLSRIALLQLLYNAVLLQ